MGVSRVYLNIIAIGNAALGSEAPAMYYICCVPCSYVNVDISRYRGNRVISEVL